MGLPALDITGGAGGAAGPSQSSGMFDSRGTLGSGTSGNRGFVNNFAAAGASVKADANVNGATSYAFPWKWAALAAVGGLLLWMRLKG